jgi:hypothetical protein
MKIFLNSQEVAKLITKDKLLHSFYGSWIYILSTLVLPTTFALALVVAIAIGKEVYDKVSDKGTPELLDIVYTIALPIAMVLIDKYKA